MAQASASVRTAPFSTRRRLPPSSITASVQRLLASKGAKETGMALGKLSRTRRALVTAWRARSMGSDWLPEKRALPHTKVATSSAALKRVTSTSRFASSFDPTTMLTVTMTGRATGSALIRRRSMRGTTSSSVDPRVSDRTSTTPWLPQASAQARRHLAARERHRLRSQDGVLPHASRLIAGPSRCPEICQAMSEIDSPRLRCTGRSMQRTESAYDQASLRLCPQQCHARMDRDRRPRDGRRVAEPASTRSTRPCSLRR